MSSAAIRAIDVRVYTVPTEEPESDGTLTWHETTVVTVTVTADDQQGLGFTYGPATCAQVVRDLLWPVVEGRDPYDPEGAWEAMVRAIRNAGRPGICSMAIAAVDTALWDLNARLLATPLCELLGQVSESVPIYGSGGFTSMSDEQLCRQLEHWTLDLGAAAVKIKIGEDWGRNLERDLRRTQLVRTVLGEDVAVMVDANGGYPRTLASHVASLLDGIGVSWFEEPVSSDDLATLAALRSQTRLDIAAGEYAYDRAYVEHMCASGAVDVMQLDVSRCAGITEWLRCAATAASHGLDISAHCAPSLHVHPACAIGNLRHLEYFADHERVDRVLFDGVLAPRDGLLTPGLSMAGTGLSLLPSAELFRTG